MKIEFDEKINMILNGKKYTYGMDYDNSMDAVILIIKQMFNLDITFNFIKNFGGVSRQSFYFE
jgi:hypothetical protein